MIELIAVMIGFTGGRVTRMAIQKAASELRGVPCPDNEERMLDGIGCGLGRKAHARV